MKLFDDDMSIDFQGVSRRLTQSLVDSGLISDTTTGGVAQILTETFAREMATFYAILEKAHAAGYLQTAKGPALDNVVAILGIRRNKAGILQGRVTFSRGSPAPRDIVIPAGAKVTGPPLEDGAVPLMETVERARILGGQHSVSVAVQEFPDVEPSEIASLPPESLTLMPRPLLGVERVTNPEPLMRSGQEENDEHLRARAGAVLREGQKGTVEAIEAAVRNLGIQTVKVVENPEGRIGCIEVRVGDPELEKDLSRKREVVEAVKAAKAAGIRLDLQWMRSVYFQPVLTAEPEDEDMDENAFQELARGLKQACTDSINGLGPGVPVGRPKLDAALLGSGAVRKVAVAMKTYTLDFPESAEEDPISTEDTGARELPSGDWYIGPLENATIDSARWQVEVARKQIKRARMNLAVTVPDTGLAVDTIRQNVRAAADSYIQRMKPKEEEGKPPVYELKFEDLFNTLQEKAQVSALEPITVIHLADGLVEELNKDHDAVLADGERLNVVQIDVKVA
jgi:hypothetical protein